MAFLAQKTFNQTVSNQYLTISCHWKTQIGYEVLPPSFSKIKWHPVQLSSLSQLPTSFWPTLCQNQTNLFKLVETLIDIVLTKVGCAMFSILTLEVHTCVSSLLYLQVLQIILAGPICCFCLVFLMSHPVMQIFAAGQQGKCHIAPSLPFKNSPTAFPHSL